MNRTRISPAVSGRVLEDAHLTDPLDGAFAALAVDHPAEIAADMDQSGYRDWTPNTHPHERTGGCSVSQPPARMPRRSTLKPPIPYFGSKSRLAPWIVSLLPPHAHYVEPYAGSLTVLLAKPRSRFETVNDLSHDLITFWRVLRDRPGELERVCALTPHSRAEHLAAYEPATDDIEVARRVWILLTQGRAGTLRPTGWRYYIDSSGRQTPMPAYLDGYRTRLHPAAQRLMGVQLECLPALDVIAKYGHMSTSLLYCDPPYLGTVRNGTRYEHEMPHKEQHRDLAAALADCRAAVVLSGYHSRLYDELYAGWHRYEKPTVTSNATGDLGRIEVVWSNRELAAQGVLDFGETS